MYALVLVIHVIVSVFLILVVLLQSGKSGDIAQAFGGGGTQTVFGPRGTSNVLTKATTVSAVIFMLTSIGLVLMGADGGKSVIDSAPAATPATAAQETAPSATESPAAVPGTLDADSEVPAGATEIDGASSSDPDAFPSSTDESDAGATAPGSGS